MTILKQKLRDILAVQLARIIKRFAFDPRYFDLWQTHGYHVKPVSFYSPLPDTQELPDELWSPAAKSSGIDWNEAGQLRLLDLFHQDYAEEYKNIPRSKQSDQPHFYLGNVSFESVDAEVFYCMVRHLRPRQIIEIGSGYSTLLAAEALKVNSDEGQLSKLTAIEPYPPKFLSEELPVPINLIAQPVQSVPLECFSTLEKNDILFIDSSHVCKIGSDVQYEFLEILPRLAPGVVVHIHDIFLPAEYPKQWVKDWHRFWNEQYLLQAFLCLNPHFEVIWAGSYMHLHHSDKLTAAFDSYDPDQNWPASFWIRRLETPV